MASTTDTTQSAHPPFAEGEARRALGRNRTLATGLLVGMAVVFVLTFLAEDPNFFILLVRAATEAGIVGGMADWFAVTALFRHPLGLPIPHTAILPRSKDRIGRALGSFIEQSFLTPEVLIPTLRQAEAARRIAGWAATPENAELVSRSLVSVLPQVVRALENSELRDFARRTIGEQLSEVDLAPLVGRAVRLLSESGEADALFDRAIDAASAWLEENRGFFDEVVRQRSRWWVPKTVDRRIATAIVDGAGDLLSQLREPGSEARERFRAAVFDWAEQLVASPGHREQFNALKARLLANPDVQAWFGSAWNGLIRVVLDDLERPESRTKAAIAQAIVSMGDALAVDEAMRARLDALIEGAAERAIAWRGRVADFVADVVASWDAATLSDRLEIVIGNDLQYIRMNGTIVGALVGCVLFLVSSLF